MHLNFESHYLEKLFVYCSGNHLDDVSVRSFEEPMIRPEQVLLEDEEPELEYLHERAESGSYRSVHNLYVGEESDKFESFVSFRGSSVGKCMRFVLPGVVPLPPSRIDETISAMGFQLFLQSGSSTWQSRKINTLCQGMGRVFKFNYALSGLLSKHCSMAVCSTVVRFL